MSTISRSLADDLRQRDDDALAQLLIWRPDLSHPLPADLGQLAARSVTQAATARAIDRLTTFELQVLEVVVVLPEPVDCADVTQRIDAPAVAVDAVLDDLHARALTWGTADTFRSTAMVKEVLGRFPAGLGPPLAELSPATKINDLIALVGSAPADVTEVLDRLTWGPPHGRISDATRPVSEESAQTPIEWLLARGLLVATDKTTVVLPREVGMHLRGGRVHRQTFPTAPALEYSMRTPAAADQAAAGTAFDVVRRIEDVLETWAVAPPSVLRTGGVGVRDLRTVGLRIDVDEITAALLVEIAYAAGLLAKSGDVDDVWLPTPTYDVWRSRLAQERWVELAQAWLETTRVPGLVGPGVGNEGRVNALAAELDRVVAPDIRSAVMQDFVDSPPGSSVDVESLVARQDWRRPRRGGRLRDDLVRWAVREAAAIGVTALGAMTSHGRALITGDAPDAGRSLASLLPTPVDYILLQADLTAVAPGPLESELARELGLLANVESSGGATVFRFAAASIRRALDAGRSAMDIHAFLRQHSKTPVPQPLTYLIDDAARRHGQIRVGAASAYIRSDDPALLDEVLVDKRLAGLRVRRLAPTVISADAAPDVVLDRLRQLGLAPAAESSEGALLLRRPDSRRTGPRQRPPRLRADPPAPREPLAMAAVRALRAGERGQGRGEATTGPSGPPDASLVSKQAVNDTLEVLRVAMADKQSVWIGYVGTDGTASERVVDPVEVRGGWLTAFDHRREQVSTFAVHRITGVAPLSND